MDTQNPDLNVTHADMTLKAGQFQALSHRYAAEGDALLAVHATWAADMCTLQAIMVEQVISLSPDPAETFDMLTTAVQQTLAAYVPYAQVEQDARGVLLSLRSALLAAFEPAAAEAISAALAPVDHLAGLSVPSDDAGSALMHRRSGGQPLDVAAARRRQAARDAMAVARALQDAGFSEDALTQVWLADWTTLETYLLESAAAAGDSTLSTVEMRWRLVCDAVATLSTLPPNYVAAVQTVRAQMVTALGAVEGAALAPRFLPVTVSR